MSQLEPSAPHPKPVKVKGNRPRRIIDPAAVKLAALRDRQCAACGGPGANGHHALPKDRGGDDVAENIISLCGSGTSGCHGAHHGSPYVKKLARLSRRELGEVEIYEERRDATWVNQRIGKTLTERRQDVIAYVIGKLGDREAEHFLRSTYAIRRDDDGFWRQAPEAAPLVHYGGCCELAP